MFVLSLFHSVPCERMCVLKNNTPTTLCTNTTHLPVHRTMMIFYFGFVFFFLFIFRHKEKREKNIKHFCSYYTCVLRIFFDWLCTTMNGSTYIVDSWRAHKSLSCRYTTTSSTLRIQQKVTYWNVGVVYSLRAMIAPSIVWWK